MNRPLQEEHTLVRRQRYGGRQNLGQRLGALQQRLTARDWRLLHWLAAYPLSRAEDLARAGALHVATIYRTLQRLQTEDVVESVRPPLLGSESCTLYHLSNLGILALGDALHCDPKALARAYGSDEAGLQRLLPRVRRLVTIQRTLTALMWYAPGWLGDRGHQAVVRWWWQRDLVEQFRYHRGHTMKLRADAVGGLYAHIPQPDAPPLKRWYGVFLLLDNEVIDRRVIRQRLHRILCYRERPGHWSQYQHFPPLLVLTTSARRAELWRWQAQQLALTQRMAPLSGAIAVLPTPEQDNPWRWSWRAFTGELLALRECFVPLPPETLPQEVLKQAGYTPLDTTALAPEAVTPRDNSLSQPEPPASLALALQPSPESARKAGRAQQVSYRIILRGAFMQRAQHQELPPSGKRTLRERLALYSLQLSARELACFQLLLQHPLLSTGELATLLQIELRPTATTLLQRLHKQGYLELLATEPEGRWRLSLLGKQMLASILQITPRTIERLTSRWDPECVSQEPPQLAHTAGLYSTICAFARAAQQMVPCGALRWWESGAACVRVYTFRGHKQFFRPDALGELQIGTERLRFWLEYDRGSMNLRNLLMKCTAYRHYVESLAWRAEHPFLPLLLFVVQESAQEERIWRALQSAPLPSGLTVLTTSLPLLRAHVHGPLGPIWRRWRTTGHEDQEIGREGTRISLFDLPSRAS